MGSNQEEKVKPERIEFQDWDDPIACQLEGLLLDNLDLIYKSAVKELSERGYGEEVAIKALSRKGLYIDDDDPIKNVVDEALETLKGVKDDTYKEEMFDDIPRLTAYTLLEMVGVLREIRPFLSDGEAMWWLLICDLNILQACRLKEDSMGVSRSEDSAEENSFGSVLSQLRSEAQNCIANSMKPKNNVLKCPKPNSPCVPEEVTKEEKTLMSMLDRLEKCLGTIGVNVQMKSQTSGEEKSGIDQKVPSNKEITGHLQKQLNLGKTHRGHGSKGSFGSGRPANVRGKILDKTMKYLPQVPGLTLNVGSSESNAELGGKAPLAGNKRNATTNKLSTLKKTGNSSRFPKKGNSSSLSSAETMLFEKLFGGEKSESNSQSNTSGSPPNPDYCAGIPYDKSLRKYLPRDEKDELILKLVPRLHELQSEIHRWTEWANRKIMQATRRLTKDQVELKRLREDHETGKQSQWEILVNKLPGMEKGLNDIIGMVEKSKRLISSLQEENALLKRGAEFARLEVLESATNYQLALAKKTKTLTQIRTLEAKNGSLQKELEEEKKMLAALIQDLDRAKDTHRQVEARYEQERVGNENLLAQAAVMRKEREQHEILAKEEEDSIKQKAETQKEKNMEEIGKLESKFLKAALKFDSSRIAALKGGTTGSFVNHLTEAKTMDKGNQNSTSFMKMMNFRNPFGNGGLRQDRECVMCLSEEMSVVFVPCSHQVLCVKCNELHEKRGMKDCPSCRTPIQRRVSARFANP